MLFQAPNDDFFYGKGLFFAPNDVFFSEGKTVCACLKMFLVMPTPQ